MTLPFPNGNTVQERAGETSYHLALKFQMSFRAEKRNTNNPNNETNADDSVVSINKIKRYFLANLIMIHHSDIYDPS